MLAFAILVYQGRFEQLVDDESLFWQVSESIEESETSAEASDGDEENVA